MLKEPTTSPGEVKRLVRPCLDCRHETDTFYGYGTAQDPIVCLACWIRRHPDIRCDRKVRNLKIVKP